MEIKRFVNEHSLEYVKSFLETLASLEDGSHGETVRTIKYFIKQREERKAEEAKIKAQKDLAAAFALQVRRNSHFSASTTESAYDEVIIDIHGSEYVVKVLRQV
jgi:hypothetical protein